MIKVVISILFVVVIFFVFGGVDAIKGLFQNFAEFLKGIWEPAKMYLCSQVLNSPIFYISMSMLLAGTFIIVFACHTKKEKKTIGIIIGIITDVIGVAGIIIGFLV